MSSEGRFVHLYVSVQNLSCELRVTTTALSEFEFCKAQIFAIRPSCEKIPVTRASALFRDLRAESFEFGADPLQIFDVESYVVKAEQFLPLLGGHQASR